MPVYRNPRSRFWYYAFRLGGSRHRGSTGETDRPRAESFERALRVRLEAEAPGTAGPRLSLKRLGELDADRARAAGASKSQIAAVTGHWRNLRAHLGDDTGPGQVTYDLVENYVATRRVSERRGQTIVREVQALRRGLKIAVRRKALARMPDEWPKVRRDPPRESQRGHLHDLEILRAYIAALPSEPRAQVVVALLTGLRAAELRRLTWAWVEGDVLRVPAAASKTKTERIVALPAVAKACLGALHAAAGKVDDVPLLAVDWRKAFSKAKAAIEYKRTITLRDLRHCYGTLGLQATGDAAAAQAALGHSQLAVTQRYQTATIERALSVGRAVEKLLLATPDGHTEEADQPKAEEEGVGRVGLEPTTLGLKDQLVVALTAAGLDLERIPDALDYLADLIEQGSRPHLGHTLRRFA